MAINKYFDSDVIYQLDTWQSAMKCINAKPTADFSLNASGMLTLSNIKFMDNSGNFCEIDTSWSVQITSSNHVNIPYLNVQTGAIQSSQALNYPWKVISPNNIPEFWVNSNTYTEKQTMTLPFPAWYLKYYRIDTAMRRSDGTLGTYIPLTHQFNQLFGDTTRYLNTNFSDNIMSTQTSTISTNNFTTWTNNANVQFTVIRNGILQYNRSTNVITEAALATGVIYRTKFVRVL